MGPDLCILLGCPYSRYDEYCFDLPPSDVSDGDLKDIETGIFRILDCILPYGGGHCDNIPFLLMGIRRHQLHPWKDGSVDQTYAMAVAILTYADAFWSQAKADVAASEPVCNMLNNWLKPATPWEKLPGDAEIAELLFGAAWILLADNENFVLADIVRRERPAFLPGLCPAQLQPGSATLPADLGMAI